MREIALSTESFEFLFNKGKIGSDFMPQDELHDLYSDALSDVLKERVIVYAQEFRQ